MATTHPAQTQPAAPDPRAVRNRLKTAAGHVRGVRRMVEDHLYCIDIINQVQAIQRALEKVSALLLEAHLISSVTDVLASAAEPARAQTITALLAVFGGTAHDNPDMPAPTPGQSAHQQRLAWLDATEAQVRALSSELDAQANPVALIAAVQDVQHRLAAFERRVLADHLNGCVTTAIRSNEPAERARVVHELLQVFAATRRP